MTEVTSKEASTHVDFSPGHISRLASLGKIKARRFGSNWMIDLESLQEYYNNWQSRKPGRKKEKQEQ